MLILIEEKNNPVFLKCYLVQDSNAYAKEILDLVPWVGFKIGYLIILTVPFFQYFNSVIIQFRSPWLFFYVEKLSLLLPRICNFQDTLPFIHRYFCKN